MCSSDLRRPLVFGGGIKMASAGRGFELDLFTHERLLELDLALGAQISQNGFDADFVDFAQPGG